MVRVALPLNPDTARRLRGVPTRFEAGHQIENVAPENHVFLVELVAAKDGNFSPRNSLFIQFEVLFVLRERIRAITD